MGRPKGSKNKVKMGDHVPHATEIPEAPPQDPRYGDKTPAYAEYLFKFFPDKAKKLYAGRKLMGVVLPPVLNETPVFKEEAKKLPPVGGDIPPGAMAHEAEEQWVR